MDLSIIIVSFNTKELTVACIKSILISRPKLGYEIIVVDNGSTDNSVEYVTKLQKTNPRLHIIENKKNLGFAKANNVGIKKARGKYILLLNSDTQVKKGAIEALYNFAQKKAEVGAVVPKLVNSDRSTQASVFRLPTLIRAIKQYWLGIPKILDKYTPQGHEPKPVEAAVMAAFLITPQALRKVGLLDKRYFMYFEDIDYCKKLKAKGLKIYYLPDIKVLHHHGASGGDTQMLARASKIYHGVLKYLLFSFVLWSGQKFCQKR